jgi:putative spermidine/putrescine transport system substrate-binding protein
MLATGAVELTTAWNGRVHDAQKEGKPIAMTFEHGMLDWLWWVVPQATKKGALAEKFIAFTLRPDRQAEFARLIPYGPSNQDALPLLDEKIAADLPTAKANLPKLIIRDNTWWAANDELVQPKWLEWKLGVEK